MPIVSCFVLGVPTLIKIVFKTSFLTYSLHFNNSHFNLKNTCSRNNKYNAKKIDGILSENMRFTPNFMVCQFYFQLKCRDEAK